MLSLDAKPPSIQFRIGYVPNSGKAAPHVLAYSTPFFRERLPVRHSIPYGQRSRGGQAAQPVGPADLYLLPRKRTAVTVFRANLQETEPQWGISLNGSKNPDAPVARIKQSGGQIQGRQCFCFFPLELPQHQGVRYVFQLFLTEGGLSRDPFVPHQAGQGERHCAEQQANGQQGQGRKSAAAVSGAGKRHAGLNRERPPRRSHSESAGLSGKFSGAVFGDLPG